MRQPNLAISVKKNDTLHHIIANYAGWQQILSSVPRSWSTTLLIVLIIIIIGGVLSRFRYSVVQYRRQGAL